MKMNYTYVYVYGLHTYWYDICITRYKYNRRVGVEKNIAAQDKVSVALLVK